MYSESSQFELNLVLNCQSMRLLQYWRYMLMRPCPHDPHGCNPSLTKSEVHLVVKLTCMNYVCHCVYLLFCGKLSWLPIRFVFYVVLYVDSGCQPDVMVDYDSDNVEELEKDGGKKSKSGRLRRRRRSRLNSLASYCSVDNKSPLSDPSLRCVSVSSTTQWSVDTSRSTCCCSLFVQKMMKIVGFSVLLILGTLEKTKRTRYLLRIEMHDVEKFDRITFQ